MKQWLFKKFLLAIILFGVPLLFFFYFILKTPPDTSLPKLGPSQFDTTWVNGAADVDTNYHKIPFCTFINQQGDSFSTKQLRGKIHVASFVQIQTKKMPDKVFQNLHWIQQEFERDSQFMLGTYMLQDKGDNGRRLSKLAQKYKVNSDHWQLLTAKEKKVRKIMRKGYFVDSIKYKELPIEAHSSSDLVLVDKKGIIRGYYKETDSTTVSELMKDMILLLSKDRIINELRKRELPYE